MIKNSSILQAQTCNLPENIQCFGNHDKKSLDPYSSHAGTEKKQQAIWVIDLKWKSWKSEVA